MLNTIAYIIKTIFDYLFAQNTPLTIMMFSMAGMMVWYLRKREQQIIGPMEQSKNAAELLKLQMTMVDDSMDELHAYLYGLYRHERKLALQAEGNPDPRGTLEIDWQTFMHSVQLWGVHAIIKNELRKYLRDNHLSDKSEDEFQIYMELRLRNIWARFILAVNEYWFSGMDKPNRSDLYDTHEKNKDQILRIIKDIMIESRRIAIKFKQMKTAKQPRTITISA